MISTKENILLPFGKPLVAHNPTDAIDLAILGAHNDDISIIHGFSNITVVKIEEDENIICDVHFIQDVPILERNNVPKVILNNLLGFSIINYIILCIKNSFYVSLALDRSKLKCFGKTDLNFIPHLVVIYGYDNKKELFFIADFSNGKFITLQATFNEIAISYSSINSNVIKLNPQKDLNAWIFNINLIMYPQDYGLLLNTNLIFHKIQHFLNGLNKEGYKGKNRIETIPSFHSSSNGFYELEIKETYYGIDAFYYIIEHLNKSITNKTYIFNIKHLYIFSSFIKLIEFRITFFLKTCNTYFFNNENLLKKMLYRTKHIYIEMQTLLNLGIKYYIRGDISILNKSVSKLSYILDEIISIQETIQKICS